MKNIERKLMQTLKNIYDDHDFVCGAMSNAGTREAWTKMYEYITYAKEHGYSVTSDEILSLSLVLGNESASRVIDVNPEKPMASIAF